MQNSPNERTEKTLLARSLLGKRAHRALVQFGILLIVAFLLLNFLGDVPGSAQSLGKVLWFVVGFYSLVRVSELIYKAVKLAFFMP